MTKYPSYSYHTENKNESLRIRALPLSYCCKYPSFRIVIEKGRRRDLNSQLSAWEADTLPLSYYDKRGGFEGVEPSIKILQILNLTEVTLTSLSEEENCQRKQPPQRRDLESNQGHIVLAVEVTFVLAIRRRILTKDFFSIALPS